MNTKISSLHQKKKIPKYHIIIIIVVVTGVQPLRMKCPCIPKKSRGIALTLGKNLHRKGWVRGIFFKKRTHYANARYSMEEKEEIYEGEERFQLHSQLHC